MDSARQALRWSIPGLIFILELVVFSAIWIAARGADPANSMGRIGVNSAVIAVFAGVPLGFLLYQLYYRNYRPFGVTLLLAIRYPLELLKGGPVAARRCWTLVRRDRGADILRRYFALGGKPELVRQAWGGPIDRGDSQHERISHVTVDQPLLGATGPPSFKVLKLNKPLHEDCPDAEPTACKTCLAEYSSRFRWNWAVVMAMIDYASSTSKGETIKEEYASASDIYHALGAARTAIATAAIGSLAFRVGAHFYLHIPTTAATYLHFAIGVVLISLVGYAQYQVIHSARERCSTNMAIRTAASLSWFSRLPAEDQR